MICDNCRKREANIKYTEDINGIKKEMYLCEECSKKLGIANKLNFKMPILNFNNFFENFFEDINNLEDNTFIKEIKELKCESCGTSFNDILNSGKYGCANCYDTFENRMDPILKKLQGANRHKGRLGKITEDKIEFKEDERELKNENELGKLQEKLKQAIKEEKYEEAAKIRDEIKKKSKKDEI